MQLEFYDVGQDQKARMVGMGRGYYQVVMVVIVRRRSRDRGDIGCSASGII